MNTKKYSFFQFLFHLHTIQIFYNFFQRHSEILMQRFNAVKLGIVLVELKLQKNTHRFINSILECIYLKFL